jgi:hypothetical protein
LGRLYIHVGTLTSPRILDSDTIVDAESNHRNSPQLTRHFVSTRTAPGSRVVTLSSLLFPVAGLHTGSVPLLDTSTEFPIFPKFSKGTSSSCGSGRSEYRNLLGVLWPEGVVPLVPLRIRLNKGLSEGKEAAMIPTSYSMNLQMVNVS